MTTPQIAWIANSKLVIESSMEALEKRGFPGVYHRTADEAIDDLTRRTKYSLIVINPMIAAGEKIYDPKIERIVNEDEEEWQIGLRVMKLVRGEGSVNRDTPMIAASHFLRQNDRLVPDILARCQQVGAIDYISLVQEARTGLGYFHDRLEQLAKGR